MGIVTLAKVCYMHPLYGLGHTGTNCHVKKLVPIVLSAVRASCMAVHYLSLTGKLVALALALISKQNILDLEDFIILARYLRWI